MELTDIRRVPHSIEAEQSVIGSILIDPRCISQVADKLSAEYFYDDKHSQIFEQITDMFLAGKSIDFVTVLEAVKAQGIFDEAEGKRVLYEMTQMVPSTQNVEVYAQIIIDKYRLRRLLSACDEISAACYEQSRDASEILDMAETRIYEIMQSRSTGGFTHIRSAIMQSYENIQKLSKDKNAFRGIPTHYAELDQMLSGLGKGNLILIAARPGIGKTSFALNIAQKVGLDRPYRTIAIFSLEMPNEQLINRMLSSQSGINNTKFLNGEMTDEDWTKLAQASGMLAKTEIYLDDSAGITVPQMKAKLRRLKHLDLVVIDYLQLMSGSGRRYDNRSTEVGDISRSLKLMAKEFNVPIITLAQLNRETEKQKRPQLSNLRESGSIEQDADAVLFLWKQEDEDGQDPSASSVVKCDIAKNRHGPTGSIDLAWTPEITLFRDISPR